MRQRNLTATSSASQIRKCQALLVTGILGVQGGSSRRKKNLVGETIIKCFFFIYLKTKKQLGEREGRRENHLSKACQAKILSNIIVGEVAKSSHPHISSNKYPNSIINFRCSKIMVH